MESALSHVKAASNRMTGAAGAMAVSAGVPGVSAVGQHRWEGGS